ncbi:MAG: site-2 protease family protein [bacterium]|nr:site-2 protease family protein [bacterium]
MTFKGLVVLWVVMNLVIVLHELGHALMGRLLGFRLKEFCVGFPPHLELFKVGGCRVVFNPIPIGGVAVFDDDFSTAKPIKRVLVILAGPLAGLLPVMAVWLCLFVSQGPQVAAELTNLIGRIIREILSDLPSLFLPTREFSLASASADVGTTVGSAGLAMTSLSLTGFLSTFLALINLLPIPGLDGGRVLLIGVEGIFGERVRKYANAITVIGSLLLLLYIGVCLAIDAFWFIFR